MDPIGMRTGIASLVIGDAFAAAVSKATSSVDSYCQIFGYDFLLCDEILNGSPSPIVSKFLWIFQNLPDYDGIFWIDGDAIIINHTRSIEDIIGVAMKDRSKDLIITRDWAGNINTGVFWIRNTTWSLDLLQEVYRRGLLAPMSRAGGWDNTAFVQLHDSDASVSSRTSVLNAHHVQINSFPHYGQAITKETFALHFAGVRDLKQLQRWIDHYAGIGWPQSFADQFWYPLLRAKVWRWAPWILEVHAHLSHAYKPSLRVAERLLRLAWLNHNLGREAKARSLFEWSLRVQGTVLGPDHHLILEPLELFRTHLLEHGHDAEADALKSRASEIRARGH